VYINVLGIEQLFETFVKIVEGYIVLWKLNNHGYHTYFISMHLCAYVCAQVLPYVHMYVQIKGVTTICGNFLAVIFHSR